MRRSTKSAWPVGALAPGQPGVEGKDVFGSAVPFRTNRLQIGRNLKLNKGGLVSAIRGNFRLRDNLLTVEPLRQLARRDAEGRMS